MLLNIRPVPAPALTNLKATAGLKSVALLWDACADPTYRASQVWSGTSTDPAAATLLATVAGNSFTVEGADANAKNYWVRSVNIYDRTDGVWSNRVSGSGALIGSGDIAVGAVNLNTHVTGYLSSGKVTGLGALAALNAIDLGSDVIGTLDASNVNNLGQLAFADTLAANKIGAGQLAAGVIYAGSISAAQITAGTLSANVIYGGWISANKISAGTLSGVSLSIAGQGTTLLDAGYNGTVIRYRELEGNNVDAGNSTSPTTNAIYGHTVWGSSAAGVRGDGTDGPGVYGVSSSSGSAGFVGASNGYDFYASGGGTNYGPFTGAHDVVWTNGVEIQEGDIVLDMECVARNGWSNTLFRVERSTAPYQKGAVGVLARIVGPLSESAPAVFLSLQKAVADIGPTEYVNTTAVVAPEYDAIKDLYQRGAANALGEGQMNVCGEGGDIQKGDYIVTSSMPGKGMKMDMSAAVTFDMMSCIVARAREGVAFSSPDQVKKVACIFSCG